MATGPEHYAEAELLLRAAENTVTAHDESNPAAALLFAEAQVHATLALAAATAAQLADRYFGDGAHISDWLRAIGEMPNGSTPLRDLNAQASKKEAR